MIFPSHSSLVPLFHSLESGTVEQNQDLWNTQWNVGGTGSLKALATKALERNKDWNKHGTTASKSGTNMEWLHQNLFHHYLKVPLLVEQMLRLAAKLRQIARIARQLLICFLKLLSTRQGIFHKDSPCAQGPSVPGQASLGAPKN